MQLLPLPRAQLVAGFCPWYEFGLFMTSSRPGFTSMGQWGAARLVVMSSFVPDGTYLEQTCGYNVCFPFSASWCRGSGRLSLEVIMPADLPESGGQEPAKQSISPFRSPRTATKQHRQNRHTEPCTPAFGCLVALLGFELGRRF